MNYKLEMSLYCNDTKIATIEQYRNSLSQIRKNIPKLIKAIDTTNIKGPIKVSTAITKGNGIIVEANSYIQENQF